MVFRYTPTVYHANINIILFIVYLVSNIIIILSKDIIKNDKYKPFDLSIYYIILTTLQLLISIFIKLYSKKVYATH